MINFRMISLFNCGLYLLVSYTFCVQAQQSITDDELKTLSESLLEQDINNVAQFVSVSTQGHTNAGSLTDNAPKPLLIVDESVYKIPTIAKLIALYDNYERDSLKNEVVTSTEKSEEKEFLNSVVNTTVMTKTKLWLQAKGFISKNDATFKSLLEDIWFTLYSRGHHKKSSSAFEHIFLGELKNGQVSGLHNWVYFNHEEKLNQLNYLGWMKKVDFSGKKGSIIKLHYTWANTNKPVGTMFIGTSPELELALYTICYFARPNDKCSIILGGKSVYIQTYTFSDQKNQRLIGSAYPGF